MKIYPRSHLLLSGVLSLFAVFPATSRVTASETKNANTSTFSIQEKNSAPWMPILRNEPFTNVIAMRLSHLAFNEEEKKVFGYEELTKEYLEREDYKVLGITQEIWENAEKFRKFIKDYISRNNVTLDQIFVLTLLDDAQLTAAAYDKLNPPDLTDQAVVQLLDVTDAVVNVPQAFTVLAKKTGWRPCVRKHIEGRCRELSALLQKSTELEGEISPGNRERNMQTIAELLSQTIPGMFRNNWIAQRAAPPNPTKDEAAIMQGFLERHELTQDQIQLLLNGNPEERRKKVRIWNGQLAQKIRALQSILLSLSTPEQNQPLTPAA